MIYRLNIDCEESITIYNSDIRKNVLLEVGKKYAFNPLNPTTKKDRKNRGRVVQILGFIDDFVESNVIVRYLDNNRRGRVSGGNLVAYNDID